MSVPEYVRQVIEASLHRALPVPAPRLRRPWRIPEWVMHFGAAWIVTGKMLVGFAAHLLELASVARPYLAALAQLPADLWRDARIYRAARKQRFADLVAAGILASSTRRYVSLVWEAGSLTPPPSLLFRIRARLLGIRNRLREFLPQPVPVPMIDALPISPWSIAFHFACGALAFSSFVTLITGAL